MRSRLVSTVLAAFGCALLWLTATTWLPVWAEEEVASLTVPAKKIPVPNTVSPELQKFIAAPVPGVAPMPATADAWRELQRTRDAAAAKRARAIAKALGATIEKTRVGGVHCYRVIPEEVAAEHEKRLLVHVHGGAYVFNGGEAATWEALLVAHACRTRVLSVDYRMPPDHPFPAALDDAVAVWKTLLADHDPKRMALFGTSAGGGLAMATVLRLKEFKLALPAVMFVGTPASDCSKTGDSLFLNAEVDSSLGRYEGAVEDCLKLYAAGRDLKDPLLSPVYGDLAGFPPTVLISGTRDLMLSATIRAHRKLRKAGVAAELHIYEGQSHGHYLLPSPESLDALNEIAQFFDTHLER
ncbi:MAG: alpha/beta hydrolase [Deltaproteobacteria bacterium]|nr:alpha/beta hydrolase [Deltaproteobacteria bacterium]